MHIDFAKLITSVEEVHRTQNIGWPLQCILYCVHVYYW